MEWAIVTNAGTRDYNEDHTGVVEAEKLHGFIVADGLGGHGKGEVASELAVKAFQSVMKEADGDLSETLEKAFLKAQSDILDEQIRTNSPLQMKTTAVALAVTDGQIRWGHIGDTRLYAFKHKRIKCRTLDHSVPQMLVMTKEIQEKEIRFHPDRNKLLRVLGVAGDTPRFEISEIYKRKKYQAFLLCTDGFWEFIDEKEIQQCLKQSKSAQEWLDRMAEIVSQHGEGQDMDNYSAIAVLL